MGTKGICQFNIAGVKSGSWHINLNVSPAKVIAGPATNQDAR